MDPDLSGPEGNYFSRSPFVLRNVSRERKLFARFWDFSNLSNDYPSPRYDTFYDRKEAPVFPRSRENPPRQISRGARARRYMLVDFHRLLADALGLSTP